MTCRKDWKMRGSICVKHYAWCSIFREGRQCVQHPVTFNHFNCEEKFRCTLPWFPQRAAEFNRGGCYPPSIAAQPRLHIMQAVGPNSILSCRTRGWRQSGDLPCLATSFMIMHASFMAGDSGCWKRNDMNSRWTAQLRHEVTILCT